MSYFSDLGLAEPLIRALDTKGYSEPTPIQRQSIPALLEGRDLLGIAQTGTGKTAAFSWFQEKVAAFTLRFHHHTRCYLN